jgi:uncharacterized protein YijF (DUF1287 family)
VLRSAVFRICRRSALVGLLSLTLSAATQTSRSEFLAKLSSAAIERTHHPVRYVSSYVRIPYPGGDVPADTGVCTDEVIRSYRALGIDLQKEVHEDMLRDFDAYPHGRQRQPDTNIDHRRVPNLMVFFARRGTELPTATDPRTYSPGEIVAWDLGGGITHIGIVVNHRGPSGSYMVVHNIGRGPQMEDVLFNWKIIGHYRYYGASNLITRSASRESPSLAPAYRPHRPACQGADVRFSET